MHGQKDIKLCNSTLKYKYMKQINWQISYKDSLLFGSLLNFKFFTTTKIIIIITWHENLNTELQILSTLNFSDVTPSFELHANSLAPISKRLSAKNETMEKHKNY